MKMKVLIKNFIIFSIIWIFLPKISFAVEAREEQPLDIEEFGSIAELYRALSPGLSFEDYLERVLEARGLIIKRRIGEDVQKSHQEISSALQILFSVRDRVREIARRRAELFIRPVRSSTPGKTVNEDGSVTYSGSNTTIAKYILRNYSQKYPDVTEVDLKEAEKRIDETLGKHAHKGFSITFDIKDKDKLNNETRIPIQVALRDENTHFLNWSFSKAITPKFAQDKELKPFIYYENTYNYVRFLECKGDWWGFNDKETNAFGWAVKTFSETLNLDTGLVINYEQDVKEMDFNLREAKKYHRKVTESFKDLYSYSYEEDIEVLDYHTTFDEKGDVKYLAKELEITRYNDDRAPDSIVTSHQIYKYDDFDRVGQSLNVTHVASKDGSVRYNNITISEVLEYDPVTKLTTVESKLYEESYIPGSLEDALRYARIIWQAVYDCDVQKVAQISEEKNIIYDIARDIAEQIIENGFSYDLAKINILAKYKPSDEKALTLTAQSLLENKEEIEPLIKQLKELRRIYGHKITLPNI